jgi:hypothetical protein
MLAAGLRQIAAHSDAEFGGESLQEHRHEIADENDAEQRVAEFGAAADVRGPVAGVHVADSHEVTWTRKREHFANPRGGMGDGNAAMGLG